jgi:hypothetical protein
VTGRPLLYVIRGPDGTPEAIHERIATGPGPKDKTYRWWTLGPDGEPTPSLQGRPAADLPLYGAQHAAGWDRSRRVFIVEGEKDAHALLTAGYRTVGTVGGAGVIPSDASLSVLIGLHLILWPDADESGARLMRGIARRLEHAAASLAWATWPDAPPGGGAADYLAAGLRVEELTLGPVPEPEPTPGELIRFADAGRKRRLPRSESPIAAFNRSVPVSLVLSRDYGITAIPGRAVRCVFHDDRHPSLSILRDDRRVFCHAPGCWAHNAGQGRDAWDLAHAATGTVAK